MFKFKYLGILLCTVTVVCASDFPKAYLGIPLIGSNDIWQNNEYLETAHPLELRFYTSWLSPISLNINIGMHSDIYFFWEGTDYENETIKYLKSDLSVGWDFDLSESVTITPYLHAYSRNFFKGLDFDAFGANIGGEFRWTPFITNSQGETRRFSIAPSVELGYSNKGVSYLAQLRFEGIFSHTGPGPGAIFEFTYEEIERLQMFDVNILFCWYF